ncbi:MAG: TetR/AcrR family transcriptional regulator [Desulfococcaceae bacterium]
MIPLKTFYGLSESKKDRITRAAVEEFSEKGYSLASINAIVARLGIAKGSIFQYFGDKRGLFLFVFDTAMEKVKNYLRTVRDQTGDENIFTRLEATLIAGLLFLQKHPMIYRLYIRTMFESVRSDLSPGFARQESESALATLREDSLCYLRSLLETAKARGEIREDADLDQACFMIDALMDRFLQARVIPHLDGGLGICHCSEAEAREWISGIIRMLRSGIGKQ